MYVYEHIWDLSYCSVQWAAQEWAPWSHPRPQRWQRSQRCRAVSRAESPWAGDPSAGRCGPCSYPLLCPHCIYVYIYKCIFVYM